MKKIIPIIFLFLMSSVYAQFSPVGYWKTIDDVSGKPKSIVHITKTANNMLMGQIVKIFPRPGYRQDEVCVACTGELRNHRIVGMVIMRGLKPSTNEKNAWVGGEILDPLSGKTYHCNITLNSEDSLTIRGYVGMPLFGRSQTWVRVGQ